MDREGGNRQRMRKVRKSESLSISSFSLHFLFISSFSLHFLAARLQGCHNLCNPVVQYNVILTFIVSQVWEKTITPFFLETPFVGVNFCLREEETIAARLGQWQCVWTGNRGSHSPLFWILAWELASSISTIAQSTLRILNNLNLANNRRKK